MEKKIGKECVTCGNKMYPSHTRCRRCKGLKFKDIELTNGKLISYTILYSTRSGTPSPIKLGIIEFENGIRTISKTLLDDTETSSER